MNAPSSRLVETIRSCFAKRQDATREHGTRIRTVDDLQVAAITKADLAQVPPAELAEIAALTRDAHVVTEVRRRMAELGLPDWGFNTNGGGQFDWIAPSTTRPASLLEDPVETAVAMLRFKHEFGDPEKFAVISLGPDGGAVFYGADMPVEELAARIVEKVGSAD